jgi:hypothetical protein
MDNHYDVVVCGPDPSGLVAAALLGRRGHRVLHVGKDTVPATFTVGPHRLASGPGVLPPLDGAPATRVLRELNHLAVVRRRAAPSHPGLLAFVGGKRVLLDRDAGAPDAGLALAWPTDAEALVASVGRMQAEGALIDPLLAADITLPPGSFWDRREVARVTRRLPEGPRDLLAGVPPDHPFRALVAALGAFETDFGPQDLGTLPPARAFANALRGHHALPGGTPAVQALFLDKLATSSGDVRLGATVAELHERRGRVVALRLHPRDDVVGLDALVWAGPASSLLALFGDQPPRRLREVAVAMRPACYRYVLAGLCERAALPVGFGPRTLSIATPTRPALEDNALLVTMETNALGPIPFWVECLIPAPAVAAGPGYLTLVRSRIRDHLRGLLPDLDRHLVALGSLHDGLPAEARSLSSKVAARTGDPLSAYPMTPALSSDLPRLLDVGAAPAEIGLCNTFLGGIEVLPGLGREGDLSTALSTARRIERALPRRRARRKDILLLDA